MEVIERPKASDLAVDELVKFYVALRDRRSVRTKAYDLADAEDKAKLEKLEGRLLSLFAASGVESTRTQFGTAYKTKVAYASLGDKDAFMQHVREHQAFDLLDIRVSKTNVQQHLAEGEELPPGVNWREEVHIRVNRA